MSLEKGIIIRNVFTVRDEDGADRIGSGDLAVLGTPALAAFIERTCRQLIQGSLPVAQTSVGTRLDLEHLKPSRIGALIECIAELTERDGRVIHFQVTCHDSGHTIGRAAHTRVIVDRERFLAGLNK